MKRVLVYGMTNNMGGIESYLMNYFRRFDRTRIMFDFITDYPEMAYADEAKCLGSHIYYIPPRRQGLLKHMAAFRRVAREGSYATVYYNLLSASGVFSLLGLIGMNTVKIVHSHNNSVENMRNHRLCRPLLNALTTYRLACSEQAGAFMFGEAYLRKKKIWVIKNAIDCERFQYDPNKRQAVRKALELDNRLIIGHVGRPCYQKNTLFLIDVFEQILQREPRAMLLLVGEGEDRAAVEEKIRTHGLDDHTMLLGMRDDIPDLMQAMDVFLLPSRFEGFPVVGIEAQASGLPCVFADTIVRTINITGHVKFIGLDQPAIQWANLIIEYSANFYRENICTTIKQAGFDITQQSKKLGTFFTDLLLD